MSVNKNDEPDIRSEEDNKSDIVKYGFGDLSGTFPRSDYFFEVSTNKSAIAKNQNELNLGGGLDGLSIKPTPRQPSQYPYNNVKETISGHVIEYDDTPGGERILIKHSNGTGVELHTDGSMIMKTQNNSISVVSGSSALVVEGNISIKSNGNLDLNVVGDLNLNVGGNINTNVSGNNVSEVKGSDRQLVYGTKETTVKGSKSETVVGSETRTILSNSQEAVKGESKKISEGTTTIASKGTMTITGEADAIFSSDNMNIGARDLSVFGATGTIGGDNVVHYGITYYGTTFYGDLDGTAEQCVTADVTNSQNYSGVGVGAAQGYTITDDGTATASASEATMESYLNNSAYGTKKITVDAGDHIKNSIDRTKANGGLSDKELTTREIRSKMRDKANRENEVFVGTAVSSGKLSGTYARKVPNNIDRLNDRKSQVRTPYLPAEDDALNKISKFKANKNVNESSFFIDLIYDVNKITSAINGAIELARGITLSKFLGGIGNKFTLDHIKTSEEKKSIARHLSMQASAMNTISQDNGEFKDHRLVVVEGLYKPGPQEDPTEDSINDRAMNGRSVVYELHDADGNIDLDKTFELASYWKDTLNFEKLILSYDTYDPNCPLCGQIVLIMPELNEDYTLAKGKYENKIETLYNNNIQSDELIEIKE